MFSISLQYNFLIIYPQIKFERYLFFSSTYSIVMASSLLTSPTMIPTTGSTVVVRSGLPFRSSLPSLRLNRPYNKSSLSISCCSPVSKMGGTSAGDLKPVLERWPEYIPHKLPDKNYVRVFDTTLRDGEQAPGGALTPPQKLEIARQLAKLRVDIMEVGFPVSSEEEFGTVKTIAKTVGNEVVSIFPSIYYIRFLYSNSRLSINVFMGH